MFASVEYQTRDGRKARIVGPLETWTPGYGQKIIYYRAYQALTGTHGVERWRLITAGPTEPHCAEVLRAHGYYPVKRASL